MSERPARQVCTDPRVMIAAAVVLEAIQLYTGPRDLETLAKAASHQGLPVQYGDYDYGAEIGKGRGICWRLSDDDNVVLLLPPFIGYMLRPHWDGTATVALVGAATPDDAFDLLTSFSVRLACSS